MSVQEKMTAIADAIRSKTGGTEALTMDQMAAEIAGMEVGGSTESILPSGYTQYEYIESSGTQWIDTGVKPTTNTEIILDFKAFGASTSYTSPFGFRGSTVSALSFGPANFSSVVVTTYCRFGNSAEKNAAYPVHVRYQLEVKSTGFGVVGCDKVPITFDGITYTEHNVTMPLFGVWDLGMGSMTRYIHMKCYRLTVKESGAITHDFVPAMRNSDNVLGMYDIINNTFHTNQGSGVFSGGELA